ncbi:hypothetical protein O1611_g4274 [Lasiodiplodia mahajangana]|uniref:Uncharacterized protein n=1 Tax=Lasiodiplodia mahajangana TaxID=1108764 RepID=A0ACC2JPE4_9PEZI|nr:hypothetical protein O1611_g4274 [Lasiodiplodia mahajangana]
MSRNNSGAPLMGFSVHQPAIGAPLQFFPAMGSKQLDEMIDAYVPGDASILDKRAAVSMEFFEYTIATGDLFKFFMVYPTLGSTSASPTMNSGSHSGFTTSPALSESQWSNPSPQMVSPSSKQAASPNDFSNLPGMKIMTKDGRDVTNSASRGCKTKEQRDHAHLMRIIKACDSCRRKKTKCDPSHKRPAAGTSSGKITKKASKTPRPAAAPPQIPIEQASVALELDQLFSGPSLDPLFAESLNAPLDASSMEWDQFIQYDEEPTEMIPYDYNFFLDPTNYFSPTTTASFSSSSTSPSQLPITPIDRDVNIPDGTVVGHDHKPLLPYLDPAGLEAGNNYVDFNLYSPQSSFLDEELGFAKEVAASPIQSKQRDPNDHGTYASQEAIINVTASTAGPELVDSYRQDIILANAGDGLLHDTSNYMHHWLGSTVVTSTTTTTTTQDTASQGGLLDSLYDVLSSDGQATPIPTGANTTSTGLLVANNVFEGVTSEGLYGRETIYERQSSRPLSDRSRPQPSLVSSERADPSARLREQQAILHGVGTISHTHSLSPQPSVIRSCGQDEPSSATYSAIHSTATRALTTVGVQEEQTNHVNRIQSTAVARDNTYRDPGDETPSPLSSPTRSSIAVTSSWNTRNTRSSTSELGSRPTLTTEKQATGTTVVITAQHSIDKHEYKPVIPWNSSSKSQYAAGVPTGVMRNTPTIAGQLSSPDGLPAISVMPGLDVLPLVVSLASLRTTIAKGSGLTEDARSDMLGDVAKRTAAILLFSVAICQPALFISLLSVITLSVIGFYIQLQRHPSHPAAQSQPFNSPLTHRLPYVKPLLTNTIDNLKEAEALDTSSDHAEYCIAPSRALPRTSENGSTTCTGKRDTNLCLKEASIERPTIDRFASLTPKLCIRVWITIEKRRSLVLSGKFQDLLICDDAWALSTGSNRALLDILKASRRKAVEQVLAPEASHAKEPNLPESVEEMLKEKTKKRILSPNSTTVVIRGRSEARDSPVVGVLIATKKTDADMETLGKGIPAAVDDIITALRGLHNPLPDNPDDLCELPPWAADAAQLLALALTSNMALVKYTQGLKEFWMIEEMGVLEEALGKGVSVCMIEKLKERAKADILPIFAYGNLDSLNLFTQCGFTFDHYDRTSHVPDLIARRVLHLQPN